MKRLITRWQDRRDEKKFEKAWARGSSLPSKVLPQASESDVPRNCSECFGRCPPEKMRQSAESGKCPICFLVYNGVQKVIQSRWSMYQVRNIRILTYFLEPDHADNHRRPGFRRPDDFGSNVNLEMNDGSIIELQFYILNEADAPWKSFKVQTNISENTGSDDAFQYTSKLLQTCLKNHHYCRDNQRSPLLNRVLDLKGLDLDAIGDSSSVKLCESTEEAGAYVCLSHCWGGMQPLKTTTATMEAHRGGIAWAEFPKTFQEAIIFTKKLQIRYIWIDSLCIVQDDTEDWKTEAQKMCSIYEGSILTISATKSPGPHGGCFASVSPQFRGAKVEGEYKGKPYQVYVRQLMSHHEYSQATSTVNQRQPLLQRGWIMQERLLGPRVLHFGPQEILWECNESSTCQCGSATFVRCVRKIDHRRALKEGSHAQIADYWRSLVVKYSTLHLTYNSDRLPALSGLATQFKQYGKDTYNAGVWQDSFVEDLLWYVYWTNPTTRVERGKMLSWSWASVNTNIDFYPDSVQARAFRKVYISELFMRQAGFDKTATGLLAGDCLMACGFLAEVLLLIAPAPQPNATNKPWFYYFRPDEKSKAFQFNADYLIEDASSEERRQLRTGQTLYCLKFADDGKWFYSLVLQCLDKESWVFERVGIVTQWLDSVQGGGEADLYENLEHETGVIVV